MRAAEPGRPHVFYDPPTTSPRRMLEWQSKKSSPARLPR